MSNASAQAQAPPRNDTRIELPGENLTIEETLRVMDVAREMREQRETAEEMFRQDDVRSRLRDKLMRTARLAGDNVTEAEVDAAIDQYLATLHTYQDPKPGVQSFLAHCWIRRTQIIAGAVGLAVAAGGLLYFLF